MTDVNLNLYQKLVQVRREVKYVQKGGRGYNFNYATESQILGAVRGKMDELNLFLECDMISLEPVECTVIKDKVASKIGGLKAVFEFKWTNADKPEEVIIKRLMLQDIESGVETVGSLMTYANRYFLYKFFSVPTDKEDPDAFENKVKKTFDSNLDISQCERVQPVPPKDPSPTAFIRDVLEIESIIESQILPVDPDYLKRALTKLNIPSLSKATQDQISVLRKNAAKKIEEINTNQTAI